TVDEAMLAVIVAIFSDDQARAVDAQCQGIVDAQGIVEGGVGIDRHEAGSSAISGTEKRRSGARAGIKLGLHCMRERHAMQFAHGADRGGGLDCLTVTTIAAYGSWFFYAVRAARLPIWRA